MNVEKYDKDVNVLCYINCLPAEEKLTPLKRECRSTSIGIGSRDAYY